MQKPQKKKRRLRVIWPILVFSFTACASQFPRLDIDLCVINSKSLSLECANTIDSKKDKTISLELADNYVSVSPDDWGKILKRNQELEKAARCEGK